MRLAKQGIAFIKAGWGAEVFSPDETSVENEMSVVQFAQLNGDKIVLTGDAGRGALTEAADYAPHAGLILPGVNRFQASQPWAVRPPACGRHAERRLAAAATLVATTSGLTC